MTIKKTLILILSFIQAMTCLAETTQTGIVQEYNEKAKKTPLAGVELNVRNANAAASDKDGNFLLQFLTLKPGEKVNVRRIEKLGYEVFNKEAIEQWNLSPTTPFVIVMCRSDKFKAIRDNYQRVASENYDKQYKKEQARLAKLKEEGKIKEAEYQQQLTELMDNYDKQLDNLDNYVDKFSRIDLSELSATEQEIIELVQQGRFDEAIQKYEDQNYLDKYRQEVADIKEVSSAIDQLADIKQSKEQTRDSLLAAIDRQIETLKLAGGKENFDKIDVVLKNLVDADTTNIEILSKYYDFCNDQHKYSTAIKTLMTILNVRDSQGIDDLSNARRVVVRRNIGNTFLNMDDYDNAEKYYLESLSLCEDSIWEDQYIPTTLYKYSEEELGRLYSATRQFDKAIILLEKGLLRRKSDYDTESSPFNISELIEAYSRLGNYYVNIQQFDKAISYRNNAYSMLNELEEKSDFDYSESKANIASDLGATYYYVEDLDSSLKFMTEAYEIRKKLAESNPDKYLLDLAQSQGNLGNLYSLMRKYDIAHEYSLQSYKSFKLLMNFDSIAYKRRFAMSTYNLATSYIEIGQHNQALETILKAIQLSTELYESNPLAYIKFYTETLNAGGVCYHNLNRHTEENEILLKAHSLIEPYYKNDMNAYAATFLNIKNSIAQSYEALEKFDEALLYFKDAMNVADFIGESNPNSFTQDRFGIWHNCINMLFNQQKYNEVINYSNAAIERFRQFKHPYLQNIYIRLINSMAEIGQEENAIKLYDEFANEFTGFPTYDEIRSKYNTSDYSI